MCFKFNSIAVPESSSLKVFSIPSLRMAGCHAGNNCSTHSFSAVYANLRHNRLCLPEYLPKKRCFNITLCMYPSVEALYKTLYLNRSSHSLSLPARASVCGSGRAQKTWARELCSGRCRRFSLPIGRESTAFIFAIDTRPIGRPNEADFDQSRRSGIYASARGT